MRVRRPRRTPLVLLALAVLGILFPRTCADVRTAVGSWLPATSPVLPASATPASIAPKLADEERAVLVARIAELEAQRSALPTADGPLAGLRRVERAAPPASRAVVARVLRRDLSPTRRTFLVAAGSGHGVQTGQPVVCGDSFVGVVVSVSASACRVLQADDRSAAAQVPALVVGSDGGEGRPQRALGVCRGTGDGRLRVGVLPEGGARPGDFALTAAGGGSVPDGLVLGRVVASGDEDRDGAWEAIVEPLRPFAELEAVTILLTAPPGIGVGKR